MEEFATQTAHWLEQQDVVEIDIGVLVSAASEWTEDETELDDFVTGLVECGRVELAIG
jgi:hypothetical protein